MTSRTSHKSYQRDIAEAFLIEDDSEKLAKLKEIIGAEMKEVQSNRRFSDATYALMRKNLRSSLTYALLATIIELQHLEDDICLYDFEIEGMADAYYESIQRVADAACGVTL